MGKYLKEFELTSQYEEYINSTMALLPNVSLTNDDNMVHYNPIVGDSNIYTQQYLTFEAIEDSTFRLTQNDCEYSLDEGKTWVSLEAETDTPIVYAGNKIMFKATNPLIISDSGMGAFSSTGKFNVEGNIMSMLYGDDFVDKNDLTNNNYAFGGLFIGCTNVVEAHNLILSATTLAAGCYSGMFEGCTSLITVPELPAITLASNCYEYMFYGCTSLTIAPELPATTLTEGCYFSMFESCTSLTTVPKLPATTLADSCYIYMFQDCTSLVTAPELPTTILATNCYVSMFGGCSNLNRIVMLATDISASNCLTDWVYGVASTGTFVKHKNMTSLPTGINGIPEGWTVQDAA